MKTVYPSQTQFAGGGGGGGGGGDWGVRVDVIEELQFLGKFRGGEGGVGLGGQGGCDRRIEVFFLGGGGGIMK